jgi:thiol-disulfide isomerase/thioredoxin
LTKAQILAKILKISFTQEDTDMGTRKFLAACSALFILTLFPAVPEAAAGAFVRRDTLEAGDEAKPFVMRNLLTGDAVYLRNYTGKTLHEPWKNKVRYVVVLSFWATWCQPCKNEIPILTKLTEEFKDQPVKFFLVNTMEKAEQTEDSVRETYKNRNYSIPCLIDPGTTAEHYSVRGLPVLVVIDKFGIVRKINRGYHENFQIELAKLLKELAKEGEPTK